MRRLGFSVDEVRQHVGAARLEAGDDDSAVVDAFARAAWSMLAEPGDGTAGLLVTALGAEEALTALLASEPAGDLAARVDAAEQVDRTMLERAIGDGLQRWRPRLRSGELVRAFRAAEFCRARLLVPGDAVWPLAVDDLGAHGPIALWVRGGDDAVRGLARSVSLVGARAATTYGEHVAAEFASALADRGITVVSGAAYGIDGMAHRAALASDGITIAFLAGGVDRFYPAGHDALLARIAAVGAVVSELPCGAQPTKWRFLQRNRLIAASSLATVVLEAGGRSGSLNTANHAAALGRPLGAVPGPITSVASVGCHRLIRENGASCVTSVDELLELAPSLDAPGGPTEHTAPERSSEELRVLDALSARSPRTADDIARRSGLSIAGVLAALGTLDLEGVVRGGERGWTKATRS